MKIALGALLVFSATALALLAGCGKEQPSRPDAGHVSSPAPPPVNDVESCSYDKVIDRGVKKVGIVRVKFDGPNLPPLELPPAITDAAIEAVLFTNPSNVADLYDEMSYGRFKLGTSGPKSYEILQPVQLDLDWSSSLCNGFFACNVANELHDRLGATEFDKFDFFILTVPTDAAGCVPPFGPTYRQEARSVVMFVGPSTTDLTPFAFAYAHEMGHEWWDEAWWGSEYNDRSSITGGAGTGPIAGLRHANAPQKILAGWLDPDEILVLNDVENGGFNEIGPLSRKPGNNDPPVVVQIPERNGSSFYTISYRIDVGYDALLANPDPANNNITYIDKLTIHRTTIGTTFLQAIMQPGASYTSPGDEFTVSDVSINDTRALFKLTLSSTDFSPPSAPVVSYTNCSNIHVTWTASSDGAGGSGFHHYEVLHQEQGANVSDGTTTNQYWDFPATIPTPFSITVRAYDTAGNFSYGAVSVTSPTEGIPPSVPTGLSAYAPHQFVTLTWTASTDNCAVESYDIERGDIGIRTSGIPSFSDNTTQELTTYTYRVRARDTAGNPSAWTSWYHVTTGPEIIIE